VEEGVFSRGEGKKYKTLLRVGVLGILGMGGASWAAEEVSGEENEFNEGGKAFNSPCI